MKNEFDTAPALTKRGCRGPVHTRRPLSERDSAMSSDMRCAHLPDGRSPRRDRDAEWSDFDFDLARWTISAEKMKMEKEHVRSALAAGDCLLEQ